MSRPLSPHPDEHILFRMVMFIVTVICAISIILSIFLSETSTIEINSAPLPPPIPAPMPGPMIPVSPFFH